MLVEQIRISNKISQLICMICLPHFHPLSLEILIKFYLQNRSYLSTFCKKSNSRPKSLLEKLVLKLEADYF